MSTHEKRENAQGAEFFFFFLSLRTGRGVPFLCVLNISPRLAYNPTIQFKPCGVAVRSPGTSLADRRLEARARLAAPMCALSPFAAVRCQQQR